MDHIDYIGEWLAENVGIGREMRDEGPEVA